MKKFKVQFKGRQSGAIGIYYRISVVYEAATIGQMWTMLYTDYHLATAPTVNGELWDFADMKLEQAIYPHWKKHPRTGEYLRNPDGTLQAADLEQWEQGKFSHPQCGHKTAAR